MKSPAALSLAVVLAAITGTALGDDWVASRLFGPVQQQVDGKWVAVARGDAIPDGHLIRTLGGGRVTLVRGTETVELSPGTQLVIADKGGRKPFTTVTQSSGTVAIEADIRNVQHFAVKTQYLAAVVKGTRFTVTTGKGQSSVAVHRGHVEVDDPKTKSSVLLSVGQEAEVHAGGQGIVVSGEGKLPTLTAANGKARGVTEKGANGNAYGIAKQAATPGNGVGKGGAGGGGGDNGNNAGSGGNGGNSGGNGGRKS